jgi:hypothetical protein
VYVLSCHRTATRVSIETALICRPCELRRLVLLTVLGIAPQNLNCVAQVGDELVELSKLTWWNERMLSLESFKSFFDAAQLESLRFDRNATGRSRSSPPGPTCRSAGLLLCWRAARAPPLPPALAPFLTPIPPVLAPLPPAPAPFLTPLHPGRLSLCFRNRQHCGRHSDDRRNCQSNKGKQSSPRDHLRFHFVTHCKPPLIIPATQFASFGQSTSVFC